MINDGALSASGQEPENVNPSISQSSVDEPTPSESVTGSRSKQFVRVSRSPGVSDTLTGIEIISSSATGSGAAIGSIVGALFMTSIAIVKVSALSPSLSVTTRVARCIPLVE